VNRPSAKNRPEASSVALKTYRTKRRFDVTPEPRGSVAAAGGHRYVIQKHAARRLHYDLRLELDGVMKSWAVTRGPSLVPGEKRLAVHVEDHPIEYNTFEGTIPKGQYGGGTVMIWDRGRWYPEGDVEKGYRQGRLTFRLDGEKLHGRWHLVRMHPRTGERQDPWLLIKADDDAARSVRAPDILEEEPWSVATKRTLDEIAQGKPARKRRPTVAKKSAERGVAKRAGRARPKAPSQNLASLAAVPPGGPPNCGQALEAGCTQVGAHHIGRQRGRAHPSGPRLLGRRRRHQAGTCRLLSRHLGPHGAACDRAAAGVVALPGRRERTVLFSEARARDL
jgi:DNA ligase D, 3''-phosphoesterase domain